MKKFLTILTLSMAALTSANAGVQPLQITSSILPQTYLVERIGGTNVKATTMVQPGQDIHTFEITPRVMMDVAKSDIYFTVGIPFEEQLVAKLRSAPSLEFSDCTKGIQRRKMSAGETAGHHHDEAPEAHHSDAQGGLDPHVWLSVPNLKIMAQNICDSICSKDPASASYYKDRLETLKKDLDQADSRISDALKTYKGRKFFVYHPAFGYFGDRYGLEQEAVEIDGKSPSPKQLAKLIQEAKEDGVKVIFVQPQFDPKSAVTIADATGAAVIPMDDLAYDVISNLKDMAGKLEMALKK